MFQCMYALFLIPLKCFVFLIQLMETGPSGMNGENVPELAAAGSTLALEPAPIPHRDTAGKIVSVVQTRLDLVVLTLAQVK